MTRGRTIRKRRHVSVARFINSGTQSGAPISGTHSSQSCSRCRHGFCYLCSGNNSGLPRACQLRRRESIPRTTRVETRPKLATRDTFEAVTALDSSFATAFLPGAPRRAGPPRRRPVELGAMYSRRSGCDRRCGVVFSKYRDHYPTPTRQRDDGTQLGPRRRRQGVCPRSLSGEPDVENVDVAEILLQDGGHTMPTTGLGRPAVSVAVVPRSISATHVWIESASQRRHSAESRTGASQTSFRGM